MTRHQILSRLGTILTRGMVISVLASPLTAWAQTDQLIVEADESLQWLRTEKQYIASGNATAQRGDLMLSANVITANYVDENAAQGDQDATTITYIKGVDNAKLVRATLTATADTIEYDIASDYVRVYGGSPTVVNNGDVLKATDSIIYDRQSRKIMATGNAKLVRENGQELHGNIITVIITPNEDQVETVVAEGKAMVVSPSNDGSRRAEAERMVYTETTGIAIMTGNVIIEDGVNMLKGDKAEINTISGTSTITSTQNGNRVGGVFAPAQ